MNLFKQVAPFEKPADILEPFLEGNQKITEMEPSEHGFLCGLIRDHRPRNIVEVGVAEGGTTAIILNCVHELALDCTLISVDLSEQLYYDSTKETAWVLKEVVRKKPEAIDLSKHKLLLGNVLPVWLHNIPKGSIDFLVLDTMHTMPGETLDFIAAFPYLAENAVVVLHDVKYNYVSGYANGIATTVLFQSVVADKFLNNQTEYPNIGAFQLNADTSKYMCNVFLELITTWAYLPEEKHLREYEEVFAANYPAEYLRIYRQALDEARQLFEKQAAIQQAVSQPVCQTLSEDSRSGARKLADKLLPKGSHRREFAKIILPKGSRRWNFCKKIYRIFRKE